MRPICKFQNLVHLFSPWFFLNLFYSSLFFINSDVVLTHLSSDSNPVVDHDAPAGDQWFMAYEKGYGFMGKDASMNFLTDQSHPPPPCHHN